MSAADSEEKSQLSAEQFQAIEAVLPEDAPAGHEAHKKVKYNSAHKWPLADFSFGPSRIRFQATLGGCVTQQFTERVARACYMQFESGASQDDVKAFRTDVYRRIKEVVKDGRPSSGPSRPAAAKAEATTATMSPAPAVNAVTPPPSVSEEAKVTKDIRPPSRPSTATTSPAPAVNAVTPPPAVSEEGKATDVANGESKTTLTPSKLSEDAPQGHAAHTIPIGFDKSNNSFNIRYSDQDGQKRKFSINLSTVKNNEEEARRILRLCYVQLQDGKTRDEVTPYKQSLIDFVASNTSVETTTSRTVTASAAAATATEAPTPAPVVKLEIDRSSDPMLTEDAPSTSEAHVKIKSASQSKGVICFKFSLTDGSKERFQTTIHAARGSLEDALRIARVCYHKFELGQTKSEVEQYRNELYKRLGPPLLPSASSRPAEGNQAGTDSRKRKRTEGKDALLLGLLKKEGKLQGALKLNGRANSKKNATVNGMYALVAGGFDGTFAYEKAGDEATKRFIFFAKEKSRWKISEELGNPKHFAYLSVKDGGKNPPYGVGPDVRWMFYDGKEAGWKLDPDVKCVKIEAPEDSQKVKKPKVKKETGDVKMEEAEAKIAAVEESSGSASESSDDESDSEASNASGSSGGSASSSRPANVKAAASSLTPMSFSGGGTPAALANQSSPQGQPGSRGPIVARVRQRACAKMLVRSGLRCPCHFSYVHHCPAQSRQKMVAA